MKRLMLLTLVLAFAMFFTIGGGNARAANVWYFSMTNAGHLEAGQNFLAEFYFTGADNGDPGAVNDGKNNINTYFIDFTYDFTKMEFLGEVCYDHYGTGPFDKIYNGCVVPTPEDPDGYVWNIMGSELPGKPHRFWPDDGLDPHNSDIPYKHLGTIYFQAKVTGDYDDLGIRFVDRGNQDTFARVDGIKYCEYEGYPFSTWVDGDVVKFSWDVPYILHLGVDEYGNDSFPQEVAQPEDYYTGAASGLQALRFFADDGRWPGQADLYSAYHSGAPGEDMTEGEVAWMLTDQTNQHGDTSPYNFTGLSYSVQNDALKRMIYWIDFDVEEYYGAGSVPEPNAPAHVPTNGAYSNNWKTVRGFASNVDPWQNWQMPADLELKGVWLNDPKATGMGYNVYQTAEEFTTIYLDIDGGYRFAAEPPQGIDLDELDAALDSIDINYVGGKPNSELKNALMTMEREASPVGMSKMKMDIEPVALEIEEVFKKVNWDEVIPGILLNSPDFKNIYSSTSFNGTMNVADLDTGVDYDLIIFSQSGKADTASVALMVEDETGAFRQASWTSEDRTYLSEEKALEIAKKALGCPREVEIIAMKNKERKLKPLPICDTRDWKTRLISDSEYGQSRFQPIYEVSTPGATVYVLQDGDYFVR